MWKLRADVLGRRYLDCAGRGQTRSRSGSPAARNVFDEDALGDCCAICAFKFNCTKHKPHVTTCCSHRICAACTNRIHVKRKTASSLDSARLCPFCRSAAFGTRHLSPPPCLPVGPISVPCLTRSENDGDETDSPSTVC
eukprot:Selendium_serpulae@DN5682_c1_g2_i1.p5